MATSNDKHDFDVTKARSDFPALATEQVFFDNAGGSQILRPVVDSYDWLLPAYEIVWRVTSADYY